MYIHSHTQSEYSVTHTDMVQNHPQLHTEYLCDTNESRSFTPYVSKENEMHPKQRVIEKYVKNRHRNETSGCI